MNQNPLNEINQTQQIKIELHKNIQILRESLRQVKNLRSTVDQVFKYLIQGYNDDFQNPDSNKQHQKFLHSLQTRYHPDIIIYISFSHFMKKPLARRQGLTM